MLKTVIIVPTYNERDNIGALIDELEVQFREMDHDMQILVVDDNSPDGTAELVRKKSGSRDNVHLITGHKAGLGAAYVRGMRYAMEELEADVVFEMDADFSHKPSDVPRLMSALEEGSDFVIGSRYVRGGTIPAEWGVMRRLNSLFGNIAARFIAGLFPVRDCTAGFRAIRTSILRKIGLDQLKVKGYAFQVALLHEALVHGAKVKEIPVEFVDREGGCIKAWP
jgi:dolichol-phosphate mannosyltransferase